MKLFSRLVCVALGHRPYPSTQLQPIPKPKPKPMPIPTVQGLGLSSALHIGSGLISATGSYVTTAAQSWTTGTTVHSYANPAFQISAFPHDLKMHVCSRCHSVFWKVGVQTGALCNTDRVPELEEWRKIKERAVWEENQRRTNGVAEKLYKQYLMTLKLGYNDEPKAGDD